MTDVATLHTDSTLKIDPSIMLLQLDLPSDSVVLATPGSLPVLILGSRLLTHPLANS
jgi:hypothetical protein